MKLLRHLLVFCCYIIPLLASKTSRADEQTERLRKCENLLKGVILGFDGAGIFQRVVVYDPSFAVAADNLSRYIGVLGPELTCTPFSSTVPFGPTGLIPGLVRETSEEYRNEIKRLRKEIDAYLREILCAGGHPGTGFSLKDAGIPVTLISLRSSTSLGLQYTFGGLQKPLPPADSPDGTMDWPKGNVLILSITPRQEGSTLVYDYVGELEVTWMDRYDFDADDARKSVFDACGYQLSLAGWVCPFYTTITMREPLCGSIPCVDQLPPVLWEITAQSRHTGYVGLVDPNHLWGTTGNFVQSPLLPNNGIDIAKLDFSENLQFVSPDGTTGSLSVRGNPGLFEWKGTIGTSWSGNFIMQDVDSSMTWSAWVRGAPGTPIRYQLLYDGAWAGSLAFTGSARLDGGGQSSGGPPSQSPSLTIISEGPATTTNEVRLYKNQFQYSRAQFKFPVIPNFVTSAGASVKAGISTSCLPIFGQTCDTSRASGSGAFKVKAFISLAQGDPPTPSMGSSGGGNANGGPRGGGVLGVVPATEGDMLEFTSNSYDPDNGVNVGDGIEYYVWRVNDTVMFASRANSFTWRVPAAGVFNVSLEIFDDEGMSTRVAKEVHATALPPDADPYLTIAPWHDDKLVLVWIGARGWFLQSSGDLATWAAEGALTPDSGLTGVEIPPAGAKRYYRLARP